MDVCPDKSSWPCRHRRTLPEHMLYSCLRCNRKGVAWIMLSETLPLAMLILSRRRLQFFLGSIIQDPTFFLGDLVSAAVATALSAKP